jgi:hypothetical protein
MSYRGIKDKVAIVNHSSTAGWMGVGYYGLAKHSINGQIVRP